MCFDWCFGTRVLPFYRDSTIAAVRDCVARKRSYTYTRFKARQFLFARTPDPLRTRSVRRASDSVQTALAESGPNRSRFGRQVSDNPHIVPKSMDIANGHRRRHRFRSGLPKELAHPSVSNDLLDKE